MKYLMLIALLVAYNVSAQDENKKRPSWSQGLPARQASIKPTEPVYQPIESDDTISSTPGIREMERPNLPNMDVDLFSTPVLAPEPVLVIEAETELEVVVPDTSNRKAAFDQYFGNVKPVEELTSNVDNPLHAEYQWKPIKTSPIEVPSSTESVEQLKLIIQINPKGKVVAVEKADPNISSLVLESAEKSILKWRFEPPSDLGITENISKTFSIEIEIEA